MEQLVDLFPGWKRQDLQDVLNDSDGDLILAIDRISSGYVELWHDQKTAPKKKEQKPKEKAAKENAKEQPKEEKPKKKEFKKPPRAPLNDTNAKPAAEVVQKQEPVRPSTTASIQIKKTLAPQGVPTQKIGNQSWAQMVKGPEEKPEPPVKQQKPVAKAAEPKLIPVAQPTKPIVAPQPQAQPLPAVQPPKPVAVQQLPVAQSPVSPRKDQGPPGLAQQKPLVNRNVKQEQPVVMPTPSNFSSIGMKFGSLAIGQETSNSAEATPETSQITSPATSQKATNGQQANGFGLSQTDYLYNAEQQRAMMGYYDPNVQYNSKDNQTAGNVQQPYPMPYHPAYYPYYYPNYGSYGYKNAAGYGYPQSTYPNQQAYQQQQQPQQQFQAPVAQQSTAPATAPQQPLAQKYYEDNSLGLDYKYMQQQQGYQKAGRRYENQAAAPQAQMPMATPMTNQKTNGYYYPQQQRPSGGNNQYWNQ